MFASAGRLFMPLSGLLSLLSLLLLSAGCSDPETGDASGTASGTAAPYTPPPYVHASVSDHDGWFEDALQSAADEIEHRRRAFMARPLSERRTIPAGPEATTANDLREDYLQCQREEVSTYRAHTPDAPASREAGAAFLEAFHRAAVLGWSESAQEEVRALGEAAMSAGCTDPLIHFRAEQMKPQTDARARYEAYARLTDQIEPATYPYADYCVHFVCWSRAQAAGVGSQELSIRLTQAMDAAVRFAAVMSDERFQHFVFSELLYLIGKLDAGQQEDLYIACLMNRKVNPWTLHMIAARYYKALAWQHRGGGFAHEVSESGWQKFHEYLPRAARHAMRAWVLQPHIPYAASELVLIANAGGDDEWEPRDWFQQAVEAQLDWTPAYDAYLWSITPRWGGSHAQMLEFAHECIDTGRWDTSVPSQAFGILWMMQQELGHEIPFGRRPGVYDVVRRIIAGFKQARQEGRANDSGRLDHWGFAAALAAQSEHFEDVNDVFALVGEEFNQFHFDWARQKMTTVRGLAAAMTGPAKEQLAELRPWVEQPVPEGTSPREIEEQLEKLADIRRRDDREVVQPYFDDLQAILTQLRAFEADEWVEPTFDGNLSGFYRAAYQHEFPADNRTIRLMSRSDWLGVQLACLAKFRPPFAVEVEVSQERAHSPDAWIGILHGAPTTSALYGEHECRAILAGWISQAQRAGVRIIDPAQDEHGNRVWPVAEKDPEWTHLRLKVFPGVIEYYGSYIQHVKDDEDFDAVPSPQITFGEILPARHPITVVLRNIRIRRLAHGPPPAWDRREDWPEYYLREWELFPREPNAPYRLGLERFFEQDYDAALDWLLKANERGIGGGGKLYNYIGYCYLDRRELPSAIEYYERAIADPEDSSSRSNLAWILAAAPREELRDGQRALSLAQETVQLTGGQEWHPYFAVAAACAELGRFEEAKEALRQARSVAPDEPELEFEQRMALLEQNRPFRIEPRKEVSAEEEEVSAEETEPSARADDSEE